METQTTESLLLQIEKLQNRLSEADQLIELIRTGEVDAFALSKNNKPEIFTLRSGDNAYRVLVENFSEGALNLSEDGLILYANTAFLETLQLSHEKVIGQNITQFMHPDSKETFNELLTKGLDGKSKGEINVMVGNKSCPVYVSLASLNPDMPSVGIIVSNLTERKQIEKELEAKKHLQNIFQNAPAAIAIYGGPAYKYILANKGYEKLTNRKAADLLGKSFKDVFPELKGTGTFELFDGVFETGEPFTTPEYPMMVDIKNDGVLRQGYFNFSMEPLKNNAGEIYAILAMTYDITEQIVARKKVEESETLFRMALFLTAKTVFKQNTQLEYTWIYNTHPTFEMKDLIGKTDSDVFGNDAAEILTTIKQNVLNTGDMFTGDIQLEMGGKLLDFAMNVEATKNSAGEIDGIMAVSDDITERRQYENNLMKSKTAAENATKAKQQFLSNMSHEIRTPLNSILGFAKVLLKTELSVQQKEFVQAIKTSGKSLNLLINDILDLAKVDAGKMTYEAQPFEIRKTIASILHSFNLKISEKNLKLEEEYDTKIPAVLLGDLLRLNQIFLNLLSNAVKFTHEGEIKLSVKLLSETEKNVTLKFEVADSGIGIASDRIDSIFKLFEQAELSTANAYGGTGLGLAIVKQLIEEQEGSISLSSKLGEGSTFSFIMPFGKTNKKSEEETEILNTNSEIKNLRVLVAEDVPLNQLLIKIILGDFGFEYEIVGNGKLAVEKMQTHTYDIILMDLQMPEMNGFEATEQIRKTLKSQIPIIALTADVTTADLSKCQEFGMNDYISKPINEQLLYSKIVELVEKNK